MKQKCEDCRYWRNYPLGSTNGECRVKSPVWHDAHKIPTALLMATTILWPQTESYYWCGEFKEKEEEIEKPPAI